MSTLKKLLATLFLTIPCLSGRAEERNDIARYWYYTQTGHTISAPSDDVYFVDDKGVHWVAKNVEPPPVAWQTNQANIAAAAAWSQEIDARPLILARGAEVPRGALLVIQSETNAIGVAIRVDDSGELYTVPHVHGSPWKSQDEIAAMDNTLRGNIRARRARLAAIQTDLNQVETALDELDLTNAGPLGTALAATTGANKAALNQVQNALQAFKVAVKNLKQASENIRKEIK